MQIKNKQILISYHGPFRYIKAKKKNKIGYLWNREGFHSFFLDLKKGFTYFLWEKRVESNLIYEQKTVLTLFFKIIIREFYN